MEKNILNVLIVTCCLCGGILSIQAQTMVRNKGESLHTLISSKVRSNQWGYHDKIGQIQGKTAGEREKDSVDNSLLNQNPHYYENSTIYQNEISKQNQKVYPDDKLLLSSTQKDVVATAETLFDQNYNEILRKNFGAHNKHINKNILQSLFSKVKEMKLREPVAKRVVPPETDVIVTHNQDLPAISKEELDTPKSKGNDSENKPLNYQKDQEKNSSLLTDFNNNNFEKAPRIETLQDINILSIRGTVNETKTINSTSVAGKITTENPSYLTDSKNNKFEKASMNKNLQNVNILKNGNTTDYMTNINVKRIEANEAQENIPNTSLLKELADVKTVTTLLSRLTIFGDMVKESLIKIMDRVENLEQVVKELSNEDSESDRPLNPTVVPGRVPNIHQKTNMVTHLPLIHNSGFPVVENSRANSLKLNPNSQIRPYPPVDFEHQYPRHSSPDQIPCNDENDINCRRNHNDYFQSSFTLPPDGDVQGRFFGHSKLQDVIDNELAELETAEKKLEEILSLASLEEKLMPLLDIVKNIQPQCPYNVLSLAIGNRCFSMEIVSLTWANSQKFCSARGGNLALEPFDTFLWSEIVKAYPTIRRGPMWIGATDTQTEGTFVFIDGTVLPSTDTRWLINSPSVTLANDLDCVAVSNTAQLNFVDMLCEMDLHFICEYPKKALFPTTTT